MEVRITQFCTNLNIFYINQKPQITKLVGQSVSYNFYLIIHACQLSSFYQDVLNSKIVRTKYYKKMPLAFRIIIHYAAIGHLTLDVLILEIYSNVGRYAYSLNTVIFCKNK